MDNNGENLKKVPECGIFDFSDKIESEYLAHVWAQYKKASKKLKSQILDEVSRNLGIHRKSAVRLLRRPYEPRSLQGFRGGRKSAYSKEAKAHLEWLWRQMCYMSPVRMKAALPDCFNSTLIKAPLRSLGDLSRFSPQIGGQIVCIAKPSI
jgi:hypothetical protein